MAAALPHAGLRAAGPAVRQPPTLPRPRPPHTPLTGRGARNRPPTPPTTTRRPAPPPCAAMPLKHRPAVGLAAVLTWLYVSCPRAAGFKLEDFKVCWTWGRCAVVCHKDGLLLMNVGPNCAAEMRGLRVLHPAAGAVEPGYTVTPGSIKVHGAYIDGLVVNTTAGATFNLRITAYSGTARIHITEAGSAQPRFEVPFVLSEDLGQHQKSWNKVKRQANSLRARLGDSTAELRLQYDPFMIDLGIDNRPAISINSRQMFQIEHHREKQV